ncbi:Beta-ketoacyl synthase [Pseudorhizobium banfieldiae]|uniref:Nodulation protein E n=1 Tax=Pseudorhizobium banfieldiae TaxID=1125847 RepID=L0NB45_9HYPH|nr:beta-ketoacyl-[acyl-carrier-protein] synthase family protein [Pseudorhizobium banfieldiae]CAD6601884.1 beta-ketoacyl-[acyl-carrier-protein] synthase family protein [arsenite-oxidising bacterium NT-25]CCF18308.1 Beta-ketoacyl synthase [Pseudorhizobium banfieldiae]
MNRVVVTGMGAVSACGLGVDRLWEAAKNGISGVSPVNFLPSERQLVRQAATLSDEVVEDVWKGAKPRMQDRVTAIALAAAQEAVTQSALAADDFGADCGVVVGSGFGGAETTTRNMTDFIRDPGGRLDPMSIPKIMTNSPASWISMHFGTRGATMCISTACASATQSIGIAAQMIRQGMLSRCIAGGSEALIVPSVFRAWELLRVMTAGKCRPFSADRDGMVLGEGAGIVVLESLRSATDRGAEILAEVAGYGSTSDASDLLRPDPRGAHDSMVAAIRDAALDTSDIAYVNAHGTGTVANEVSESEALRNLFGNRLGDVLVSSTKPIHGHALGAAGAIEFIVTVKALRERLAPPTINFTSIDPKLGIDPVANIARAFDGAADACLSNSFAFGGINASLLVKRFAAPV